MRPLGDLVGQRVRWEGVLDYWDQNRACFRCVELLPYCAEGGPVRKIDHLWCWFPAQEATEKLRDRVTRNYEENQRRLSAQVHYPLTRDPKIPGRKVGRAIGFAN